MRLAELMGTFSLAADVGMGMPMEHGLRAATVAVRLGERAKATEEAQGDAFQLALLRYVGCTADSDVAASVMGDEVTLRGELYGTDWGAPGEVIGRISQAVGRGKGALGKVVATASILAKMPRLLDGALSHCEVGDRLAERIGFEPRIREALFQSFERWDGKGWPRKLRGERVALTMRLAQIGEIVEVGHRAGGVAAARALVAKRAGGELDPALAERFAAHADEVCACLDAPSAWKEALAVEPRPHRAIEGEQIDEVLRALGDFADLKSRFTRGHAAGVSALAREAAKRMGLSEEEQRIVARAGFVHDVGRVGTTASIWDKPGPLTDPEWERVRMHTYLGERILAKASGLAEVAEVAALAHERVDGSGYHRRLKGAACTSLARVLAAADVYQALIEDRAHRPRHLAEDAAKIVSKMAKDGALCPDAVTAVLAAAGHATRARPALPSGLTERELEVLRLVARGLTNKEVAAHLGIAAKTAGNHVQSIFAKVGVTTRAGATMFAMQKGIAS